MGWVRSGEGRIVVWAVVAGSGKLVWTGWGRVVDWIGGGRIVVWAVVAGNGKLVWTGWGRVVDWIGGGRIVVWAVVLEKLLTV